MLLQFPNGRVTPSHLPLSTLVFDVDHQPLVIFNRVPHVATSALDAAFWVIEIGEYDGEVVNRFEESGWVGVQLDGN